jgi:putative beta barrel porin BBP7
MRIRSLAALTVLLIGHRLALAQQYGPYPDPTGREPVPPTAARSSGIGDQILSLGDLPDGAPAPGDVDAQAETFGFWGSGEYLLWWFKNGRVPPLVTAGGNGKLGSPGTQVLLDNLNFDDDARQGGRFALGYHFETLPFLSVEANYFFLTDRQPDVGFSSSGDPILGRPFINAATGLPDATLISSPGIAAGSVSIGAQTSLWGAEANLTADLIRSDTLHLTALGGFRFLRLEDDLKIDEQFRFAGNTVGLVDDFRTVNCFYGGQVGLETGVQLGLLTINFRGTIGLGDMHKVANVNGVTDVLGTDGSMTVFQGGLLALRSNIGRQQQDELAFIPEVGFNVGLQLTRHLKLYAGYSLLWVSTVARAGEEIDPVVNVTQFPILAGNGPLVGPARPAFKFEGAAFWAQGLNLGLDLRY